MREAAKRRRGRPPRVEDPDQLLNLMAVIGMRASGFKTSWIARQFGVTDRTIRNWLRDAQPAPAPALTPC